MNNELKRTKRWTQYLMLFLQICSIFGDVTDADCFISKLKTCIELHEEHTKNAATQPFTVFRVVNHKMRIDDLVSLYETFTNKKDMEDHLTVMTIAYDISDEPYNKKTFAKEFISAIQQIVDLKTSYVTQGNLSMNVKYIEREHMSEIVLSDITLAKIDKIHRKFNEWIVANFITICKSLLKVFITQELQMRILVLIERCKNNYSADSEAELWIEQMSYAVIGSLRRISKKGIFNSFMHQLLLDNQVIYNAIHDIIVQYEKSIDCSYFTDDIYAFKKTYVLLFTDKYFNVIKKSFLFMIKVLLSFFRSMQSINFVKDIYRTTLIKITQDIDAEVIKKEFDHAEMNIYFEEICQTDCFQNKVESLLQFLYSDISQSKLAETLQKNVDEVYQAPHDAMNLTIAFEYQLDEYNMYRICRILNDIEAFKNHHQNQFMYIEDASNCAETSIHIDSDSLNTIGLQSYSDTESIIISCITFAPLTNPLTYKVYSWTHNPITSPAQNNFIASMRDVAFNPNNTTISLDQCHMIGNDLVVDNEIPQSLKRSNSKMNVLLKINIHYEKKSLHVYVLNHVSEDGFCLEHNTLVYVLHSYTIDDENLSGENQTKQTKCVDAFTAIYDNLLFYVQYLQLGKGTDIEIPNIRLFGSKDFAYSEETLMVRLHKDPFAIRTPHSWFYFVQASISYVNTAISIKEIIEFGIRMDYENYDSYTLKVLRRKGISSHTLNQILYKFVLNKDVAYRPEEYPLATDKHKTDCSTILYLDFNSDNSVILNICTLKAYNHFHHVMASVDKIIEEISENENDLAVYNAIDEGLKNVSPKLSLRQLIIDDFCKRSIPVEDSKKCVPIGSGTKGTMATILNSLDTLFLCKKAKTCQAITKSSLSSHYLGLQNVQQIIKPEEIVRLEKIISEKFKDLVWTKHYTFTRIKLFIPDPNVSA